MKSQVDYNEITCQKCGTEFRSDLASFDFGIIFREVTLWDVFRKLDLKFYYSLRDLCQLFQFKCDFEHPSELVLKVKNVKEQLEFLSNGFTFDDIAKNINNPNVSMELYNEILTFEAEDITTSQKYLKSLIRILSHNDDELVIAKVNIQFILDKDDEGNELPVAVRYYLKDQEAKTIYRVCPVCGKDINKVAGFRKDYTIALIGLENVGKTSYLASLIHQLKTKQDISCVSIDENDLKANESFLTEVLNKYEQSEPVSPSKLKEDENICQISIPIKVNEKKINFTFIDVPGEIFNSDVHDIHNYLSNNLAIVEKADAVWIFTEPSMFDLKKEKFVKMNDIILLLNSLFSKVIPASIIITKSDTIPLQYGLYKPEVDTIDEYLDANLNLNVEKIQDIIQSTKRYADQLPNFISSFRYLFSGLSLFPVSMYGRDVNKKVLLSNQGLNSSLVELPFIWTMTMFHLLNFENENEDEGEQNLYIR